MFKYWETHTVYCYRFYDENDLQTLANRYSDYLNDERKVWHNEDAEQSLDTFSDFLVENESFIFHDNYDFDYEDSNIQDLYDEVKKYL